MRINLQNVLILLAFLAFAYPNAARAAALPDETGVERALQQNRQIIQEQEERRRQLEEGQRQRAEDAPKGLELPKLEKEAPTPGAPCMQVNEVVFSGSELISHKILKEAAAPYEGRCLALSDIHNLVRDLNNMYLNKGYITTRVLVDPQQQPDGKLRLVVLEGKVEDIVINDNRDKWEKSQPLTLFPGVKGQPLQLRDIEQGLDQLNRLASSQATMELLPGSEPGTSIINIKNEKRATWRVNAGLDNLGQQASGQWQYTLGLEKDNLVGLADQWAVYVSGDAPPVERMFNEKRPGAASQSVSGFFSIPFGYWSLTGSLSQSSYNSLIKGRFDNYMSSGETLYGKAGLDRVIHRNADSKTSLGAFFASRNSKSYFEGVKLESSYLLSNFGLSASHSRRLLGGSLSLYAEYAHGLHALDATRDFDADCSTPKSLYRKVSASFRWYRPFELFKQDFYWSFSGYGQLTPDTLRAAERIQVGSRGTVRGFQETSLSGDQGGYLRNDLGWNIKLPNSWNFKGMPVQALQVYTGYDFGVIKRDNYDPYERGRVHGVALGLRTLGDLSIDFCVSKAVSAPQFINVKPTEIYLSLSYTF